MLGVYRIDNRFRSNAALKARYPISDPIFIGSDRTAKNSDSVTISDTGMRGGKMEIQVMVLPKEHAFLIIHLFTLPTRAEGRAERHPPPLEARRSYRMWGASLSDPTTDPITDLSELPIRYNKLIFILRVVLAVLTGEILPILAVYPLYITLNYFKYSPELT